jgi:hypothetical protein
LVPPQGADPLYDSAEDGLDGGEFLQAFGSECHAKARLLDAPKGGVMTLQATIAYEQQDDHIRKCSQAS